MKATIGAIIGAIATLALFAFAQWDLNPGNWGGGIRCAAATVMVGAALIGAMMSDFEI
jgi:hypothetical protein